MMRFAQIADLKFQIPEANDDPSKLARLSLKRVAGFGRLLRTWNEHSFIVRVP